MNTQDDKRMPNREDKIVKVKLGGLLLKPLTEEYERRIEAAFKRWLPNVWSTNMRVIIGLYGSEVPTITLNEMDAAWYTLGVEGGVGEIEVYAPCPDEATQEAVSLTEYVCHNCDRTTCNVAEVRSIMLSSGIPDDCEVDDGIWTIGGELLGNAQIPLAALKGLKGVFVNYCRENMR